MEVCKVDTEYNKMGSLVWMKIIHHYTQNQRKQCMDEQQNKEERKSRKWWQRDEKQKPAETTCHRVRRLVSSERAIFRAAGSLRAELQLLLHFCLHCPCFIAIPLVLLVHVWWEWWWGGEVCRRGREGGRTTATNNMLENQENWWYTLSKQVQGKNSNTKLIYLFCWEKTEYITAKQLRWVWLQTILKNQDLCSNSFSMAGDNFPLLCCTIPSVDKTSSSCGTDGKQRTARQVRCFKNTLDWDCRCGGTGWRDRDKRSGGNIHLCCDSLNLHNDTQTSSIRLFSLLLLLATIHYPSGELRWMTSRLSNPRTLSLMILMELKVNRKSIQSNLRWSQYGNRSGNQFSVITFAVVFSSPMQHKYTQCITKPDLMLLNSSLNCVCLSSTLKTSGFVASVQHCTASWIGILGRGKITGTEGVVPAMYNKSIT